MNRLCNALEAVAVQRFPNHRIPLHVWAMVAIGVVGFLIVWFTR